MNLSKCNNGKYYPASRFTVTDTLLTKRLAEFGIIQRKSYIDINYLDYIPDEYKMAWVFSLFDGDGGITLLTDDRHRNSALVHFTGRKDFLIQLGDYLGYSGSLRDTKTEASVLRFSRKHDTIDFLSKYIDFAEQVQVLERKLAKANEALEIMLHNDKYYSGTDKIYTATCEVCGKSFKSVGDKKCRECLIEEYKNRPAVTNKKSNNQEIPCSICGKPTKGKSKQGICVECAHKQQARTDLTPETLQELMKTMNFTQLGKKYGVSANAIKKRAVNWGIYEYLLDASNNSERAIVYRDIYNSIYSENIKESISDMS